MITKMNTLSSQIGKCQLNRINVSGNNLSKYAFYAIFGSGKDKISKNALTVQNLAAGRPIDMDSGDLAGANEPTIGADGLLTYGAYTQLMLYSDEMTQSGWSIIDGSTTATTFTATAAYGVVRRFILTTEGLKYTISFKAYVPEGNLGNYTIQHDNSASGNSTGITLTREPTVYTVTVLGRVGDGIISFGFIDKNLSNWVDVYITDWQVTESSYRMPYVKSEGSTVAVPNNYSSNATHGYQWTIGTLLNDALINTGKGQLEITMICPDGVTVSNNQYIISCRNANDFGQHLLRENTSTLNSLLIGAYQDSTHQSWATNSDTALTEHKLIAQWGTHPTEGANTLIAGIDDVFDTTPGDFSGAWGAGGDQVSFVLSRYTTALFRFKSVKVYKEPQDWGTEANIYIDSSASAGGDGSESSPYNSFSDLNWSGGGPLDISDLTAAGYIVNINLKCGSTFNETLTLESGGYSASKRLVVQSYGTGNKPLIKHTVTKNSTSDWVDQGGNIWRLVFTEDVGQIHSEGSQVGFKKWDTISLDTQGDYYNDCTNGYMYLYSVGNPATFYNADIEMAYGTNKPGVFVGDMSAGIDNVLIQGIETYRTSWNGIELSSPMCENITVQDCTISWAGGQRQGTVVTGTVRNGGGINIQRAGKNILFQRNDCSNCYDGAIQLQGYSVSVEYENLIIRYNILRDSTYNLEAWGAETTSKYTNVYFVNNTLIDAGGWSQESRPDPHAESFRLTRFEGSNDNIQVKNNIVYGAASTAGSNEACVRGDSTTSGFMDLDMDYNLYYRENASDYIWYVANDKGYTASEQAEYIAKYLHDENSTVEDPLLTGLYKVLSGSPALNAGVVISGVNDNNQEDIWGNETDSTPNIGAYQGSGE